MNSKLLLSVHNGNGFLSLSDMKLKIIETIIGLHMKSLNTLSCIGVHVYSQQGCSQTKFSARSFNI